MNYFNPSSVLFIALALGFGTGVFAGVRYLLKKTVDLGFDIAGHKIKMRIMAPEPAVELYDPFGRVLRASNKTSPRLRRVATAQSVDANPGKYSGARKSPIESKKAPCDSFNSRPLVGGPGAFRRQTHLSLCWFSVRGRAGVPSSDYNASLPGKFVTAQRTWRPAERAARNATGFKKDCVVRRQVPANDRPRRFDNLGGCPRRAHGSQRCF